MDINGKEKSYSGVAKHWSSEQRYLTTPAAEDYICTLLDSGCVRVGDELVPADRDSVINGAKYHVEELITKEREYLASLKNTVKMLEEVAIRRGSGSSVTPAEFERVEAELNNKNLRPEGFLKTMPTVEDAVYTNFLTGFRPWATELDEEIQLANRIAGRKHVAYPDVKRIWSVLPESFIIIKKLEEVSCEMDSLLQSVNTGTDEEFFSEYKQLYLSDKEEYRWLADCLRHKVMILEDICIIRGLGNEVSLTEAANAVMEEGYVQDFVLFKA